MSKGNDITYRLSVRKNQKHFLNVIFYQSCRGLVLLRFLYKLLKICQSTLHLTAITTNTYCVESQVAEKTDTNHTKYISMYSDFTKMYYHIKQPYKADIRLKQKICFVRVDNLSGQHYVICKDQNQHRLHFINKCFPLEALSS